MALGGFGRLISVAFVLAMLSACSGFQKPGATPLVQAMGVVAKSAVSKASAKRAGKAPAAAAAPVTRADLEKLGKPVILAVVAARSYQGFLSPSDAKGNVVTWSGKNGTTFTFRGGILIQTRGLGPDLMSAEAPSVAQLLTPGGTHSRAYYFLGANDQSTRRQYNCTVAINGKETLEIYERSYNVTHVTETCSRPQGSMSNEFWIDGNIVRKSHELLSGGAGYVDFVRIID